MVGVRAEFLLSRRRSFRTALSALVLGGVLAASSAWAEVPASTDGFGDLAKSLLPAVVNISSTSNGKPAAPVAPQGQGTPFDQFFKDFGDPAPRGKSGEGEDGDGEKPGQKSTSLGSGFIIDPAGLIVTNNHVIDGADSITVILPNDTKLTAELVGRDLKTDLALLRVKAGHPLPSVAWGDSDTIKVGDWVIAVGNPFGLGGTMTAGILSARGRAIGNDGPYDDFLQTDASINRGNSGGPLFNLSGQVIGINSAIFSPSGGSVGIGFAIPSDLARHVIAQLDKYGHARRGWMGVRLQTIDPMVAGAFGLEKPEGVLIAAVTPNGPAAAAGLQPGDVVTGFAGHPVADIRRFQRLVAEGTVDAKVQVTIWRQRKDKVIEVKLGELDEKPAPQVANLGKPSKPDGDPNVTKALGLTLSAATPELKEKFQLGDNAAIVITAVAKGSAAGEKDLRVGDVVVEIGQEEVRAPAEVTRKIDDARKAGRKTVLFLVDRGGELRYVALRLDRG
jgi:serine protease Do